MGECKATVVDIKTNEPHPVKNCKEQISIVVLDQTIFHPQGGGQPADKGKITSEVDGAISIFNVLDVRTNEDRTLVYHYGHFEPSQNSFSVDSPVTMVSKCYSLYPVR